MEETASSPGPLIPVNRFSVFAAGLDHPKCLAFDRVGHLWAGGEAGQIYRIDKQGKVSPVVTLGTFIAGLAFSPDDQLLVCQSGVGVLKVRSSGRRELFASHAGDHRIRYANFGVFDEQGNYYLTDSGNWMQKNGYLLRFTPNGNGQVLGGPFGYVNGLALTADQRTLYMVESDTDSIFRLDIAADGAVSKPTLFASNVCRFPDGLTLDSAGNLFVCCYASDEIIRFTPQGEKQLFAWDRWAITLARPTNAAFGGHNMNELYVANLGRYTIVKAQLDIPGQPLANQRRR